MFHQVHTVKLEPSKTENKRLRYDFVVEDENCICNEISNNKEWSETEFQWNIIRVINSF